MGANSRGGKAVSALRSGRTAFLHRAQQGLSVPGPSEEKEGIQDGRDTVSKGKRGKR